MHTLLGTASRYLNSPIEDGDAGIVLKPDGSFKLFSTGKIDFANMTEAQLAQGEKLVALAIALTVPDIMTMLNQMASDPNIVARAIPDPQHH